MRDILSEALLKVSAQTSKPRKIEPSKANHIDLYKLVCKDKDVNLRYSNILTGVYHDPEGWAVVTDTRTLVASRAAYRPEYSGKIIDKNGNEITTRQFPKWKTVVPKTNASEVSVDAEEIKTVRTQMLERIKQDNLKQKDCLIVYKLGNSWFNIELLTKVAQFVPSLKTADYKASSYVSDDLIVLVMPMMDQTQGTDLNPSTYAILRNECEVICSLARTATASVTSQPKRKLNNLLAI